MNDRKAIVKENKLVARDTYLMTLECGMAPSVAGQFVMVRINDGQEPFLRRPLAILKQEGTVLQILYKLKGKGSVELSRKLSGDSVSILGPLGNGFAMPRDGETAVYIAGGTGLPPVLALAEQVGRGSLIIGARSAEDLALWDRIRSLSGIEAFAVTEDGTLGRTGLATDVLGDVLSQAKDPCIVYACGPTGMLKAASELARKSGARCQVSLEEYMACGFGVCCACAVKTISGNQRVCTEGPVFNAGDIAWGS